MGSVRWWLALVAGCFHSNGIECSDGTVCPPGLECAPDVGGCLDPQACVNVPNGTACGSIGVCLAGTCTPGGCGNGIVEHDRGEECDDSNLLSHDGCSSSCRTETLVWSDTGASGPCQGLSSAMAYDIARGVVVIVPATVSCGAFVLRGATATPSAFPGTTNRFDQGLAYETRANASIDFGGYYHGQTTDQYLADTWSWNGTAWTKLTPSSSPSARGRANMATLRTGGVLLFGGQTSTGAALADTWLWNGTTWQLQPASPAPAASVNGNPVAFDAARDDVLSVSNGTWAWDGAHWKQLQAALPTSWLAYGAMAYDATRGRAAIEYAGQTGSGTVLSEWDGAAWQPLPSQIPASLGIPFVYDSFGARFIVLPGDGSVQQGRWTYPGEVDETCMSGVDADGDGLAGCADPDCWARCTPYCSPGAPCDPNAPHCGDGTCNVALEQGVCPADCP